MVSISGEHELEEEVSVLPKVDLGGNAVVPPIVVKVCDILFHKAMNKLIFWRKGRVFTRFHISENHVLISLLVSLAASLGTYGYWKYRQNLQLVLKLIDLYHSGTLEKVLFAEDAELRLMNKFYKKEQIRMNEVEILVSAELRGFYEQCSRMIVELHNSCDHLLNGLMEIRMRKIEEAARMRDRRRMSVGRGRGRREGGRRPGPQGRVHGEVYTSDHDDSANDYRSDDSSEDENNDEIDELREFLDKIQEKMDELNTDECVDKRRVSLIQTVMDEIPGEKSDYLQMKAERIMRRKINRRRRKQMEERKDQSSELLEDYDSDDYGMPFEIDKANEKFYDRNGIGITDGIPLDDFRSSLIKAVAVSPPSQANSPRDSNGNLINPPPPSHSDEVEYEYQYVLNNEQRKQAEEFLIHLKESNMRMQEQAYWMKVGIYSISFSLFALSFGSIAYDKYQDWKGGSNNNRNESSIVVTDTQATVVS